MTGTANMVLFGVRAGFWLVITALAVAAMATKKSLYTFSVQITTESLEGDIGMFKSTGSWRTFFPSSSLLSGSVSMDTTSFFDDVGLGKGEAMGIQASAALGLCLSFLSFCACAAAFMAPGCCSGVLKAVALLTDLLASVFFLASGAVILVAFHQNILIESFGTISISDVGDLGPGMPLLATCGVLSAVCGYMACCITPRHSGEKADTYVSHSAPLTANAVPYDYQAN